MVLRGTITPGRPAAALGGVHLGQGQAVAVGGHGAQLGHAAVVDGVQVQAVQIVAGLFGRDREPGLVDQPHQVVGVDRDPARQAVAAHHREVAGRQDRQVEARAAGLDHQAGVVAAEAERDVRAVGQLADDFIQRVGRGGDLAGLVDLGQALVDDLHVQVGGRERQGVAVGRQQDVRQDRDGVAALDDALHVTQRLQQRRPLDGKLHFSVQVPGRRDAENPPRAPQ
jgi:hypothetical protein